jgi:hypothetical protein
MPSIRGEPLAEEGIQDEADETGRGFGLRC